MPTIGRPSAPKGGGFRATLPDRTGGALARRRLRRFCKSAVSRFDMARESTHDACLVRFASTSTKRAAPSRWIVAAVVLVAFLSASSAAAQRPPGDVSGVDQYVEQLPGAGGNQPTGPGGGNQPTGTSGDSPVPLPRAVRTDVRRFAGDDAPLLEAIATSPALGAPREQLSRSTAGRGDSKDAGRSKGSGGGGVRGAGEITFGEAIESGVGALAEPEDGGGPSPLLIALLAISAALVATAVWRGRRNRA